MNYISQPQPVKPVQPNQGKQNSRPLTGSSFAELLHKEVNKQQEVKLSAHAQKRLQQRNIVLTEADLAKINQAVQRAEAKGAKDSLLLYGDLALIASIKNKTVVTAMDGQSIKEHVFTNIDSAVIIK
ncbi:MAG: flagellar protein [Desulfotomaculum sp.]|nr:flagellar protein [Desulfotomaculum sp.]